MRGMTSQQWLACNRRVVGEIRRILSDRFIRAELRFCLRQSLFVVVAAEN